MKTSLCVIGTVLALTIAAPVSAQDAADPSGIWAPWATTREDAVPAPQVRAVATVTKVATEVAPQPETIVHRILHLDRFWVVGSFR